MLDALPPELQEEVLPGLVQGQIDIDLVSFQSQLDSCGHPDAARLSRLLNPAADPA